MAESNLSFKTAFKRYYDPPSDSKSLFPKEHVHSDTISSVPKHDTVHCEINERACSDDTPEIIALKAKAEAKVNDWFKRCQSSEVSFQKKTKSKKCSSYSNQRGEVPVWNKTFKEILGSKSDLKKEEPNGIERSFQKSVTLKKLKRRTAKKKLNPECDEENMSDNNPEVNEEDKVLLAEAEAEFASWGKFKLEVPSKNDFDGAGVDIYNNGQSICETLFNMPQDFKDVIVGPDPYLELIEKHRKLKKQIKKICNEHQKNQMKQVSNKISNETIKTKESEKQNQNSSMQKSNTIVQQMDQVDNSNYQNNLMSQDDNSNYRKKQMEKVDNRNFQNKDIPDGCFILKKSNTSEKQMEDGKNKNRKKKNQNYHKEINETEIKLYGMFTTRNSCKNIHSSGDVYSVHDANLEADKKKEIKSPYWEHVIVHPIIDQPLPLLPNVATPRLPPPPPVPFDEPAWDDEFY